MLTKNERIARLQAQVAALRAALDKIVENAPDDEPLEEDYDDTESAYYNGQDVTAWQHGEWAREPSQAQAKARGRSRLKLKSPIRRRHHGLHSLFQQQAHS
jgi:hypothetical protein